MHRPDVFVAGDLLWYPVEGKPEICIAPDAMVAFGRPKGERGSYKQWEEGGVAPQVVCEVLSPDNRVIEMEHKLLFYEQDGVQEYYIYDPDYSELFGRRRVEERLKAIPDMNGWISPLLGVRFDLGGGEPMLFGPDGRPFLSFQEIAQERDRLGEERDRLARERDLVAQERDQVAQERDQALGQRDAERQRSGDSPLNFGAGHRPSP